MAHPVASSAPNGKRKGDIPDDLDGAIGKPSKKPRSSRGKRVFNFGKWVLGDDEKEEAGLTKQALPDGRVRVTMPDGKSWLDYSQLDEKTAHGMFAELSQNRHYNPKRDPAMFGNTVPRDQSFFFKGKKETNKYRFGSGPAHVGKTEVPPLINSFWEKMTDTYGEFNFAVLNRYTGSQDSIPAHSDSEAEIVPGSAIPSLSLGATRTFVVRSQPNCQGIQLPNYKNRLNVVLWHGAILVMGGNFQNVYTHEVPKGGPDETRVNLTLRKWVGQ